MLFGRSQPNRLVILPSRGHIVVVSKRPSAIMWHLQHFPLKGGPLCPLAPQLYVDPLPSLPMRATTSASFILRRGGARGVRMCGL